MRSIWLMTMCMSPYIRVFSKLICLSLISLNNLLSYLHVNMSVWWLSLLVQLWWRPPPPPPLPPPTTTRPDSISSEPWLFPSPIIENPAFHPGDTSQSLRGDWWRQTRNRRAPCFPPSKPREAKAPRAWITIASAPIDRGLVCIRAASVLTYHTARSWVISHNTPPPRMWIFFPQSTIAVAQQRWQNKNDFTQRSW